MYQAPNAPDSTTFVSNNNKQQYHHQQQQQQYETSPNNATTIIQTQQSNDQCFQRIIEEEEQQDSRLYGNNDSIRFTFEEIGAIINSKNFEDFQNDARQPQQQQQQYQQQRYSEIDNELVLTDNQDIKYTQIANQQVVANNQDNNFYDNNYQQQQHQLKQTDTRYDTDDIKVVSFYGNDTITTTTPTTTITAATDNNMAARNNQQTNNKNNYLFNPFDTNKSKPFVEIVEQPAKCALRFRYKCEGRSAGSLPGINSTADNKTFPAIRINNYVGRAVVVISCVTQDAPYRAHPHNIVGKEGCKKGICTIVINNESNMIRSFSSLGIQCVKRKDIEESLSLRESINVDPFRNGFAHKLCASNIDLNVVRLCFQVFIEGSTSNKCDVPLTPIVSDPIHDKKAMSDLVITKLSHCSAPATGGREVILLCDRISKDDIQIRFYEERDSKLVWEAYSDLSPTDVHKQVAICFKTPKYYNENITQPVMVLIQLKRVSDNQTSEPRLFQFLPCESDEDIISRKRQKIEWVNMNHCALDSILQPHQQQHIPGQVVSPINQHHHQQQAQQQLQLKPQTCLIMNQQQNQKAATSGSDGSPSPQLQPQKTSPVPLNQQQQQQQHESQQTATTSRPARSPKLSPSATNQQQQNRFMIDTQQLVVRREIIDNEGKVMRLVDRPSQQSGGSGLQQQEANNIPNKPPLGSSLDRIDTAELMRDMPFNSNMDLNLGSNLSIHLNGASDIMQMDHQQHHVQASSSSRVAREISCNNSHDNKNCQ